jgi:predicted nucleic acid-binding protein
MLAVSNTSPVLNQLRDLADFRIGAALYDEFLRAAQET